MKYRLTEDWLEYKKGHVFEEEQKHLIDFQTGMNTLISPIILSLLIKTGILEEVKEEIDVVIDVKTPERIKRIYPDFSRNGLVTETADKFNEIIDAVNDLSEKIKTLLLSLKK